MDITDMILEASGEFVRETADALFEANPLLESFSWIQGYGEERDEIFAEEFLINEDSYHSGDREWRLGICNQLRWAFDTLEPTHLMALYGRNMKVKVIRDEIEVSSAE